jgi:hypothetical protein
VQDESGEIWVLPDEGHGHPKVLGEARPAMFAGDLTILHGTITDVTNLSGTFRCASRRGLRHVARTLRRHGLKLGKGALRFFPKNGGRPEILE